MQFEDSMDGKSQKSNLQYIPRVLQKSFYVLYDVILV